ncbi:MAG TPA: radical SAM family heme chaperone HemW [Vicinamibacterales bacterium]|nr:radical SAM family heme chaperone HemW [Vicinamibacterales bacterium]
MLGLYVHVPFCAAICNYCNFNRGLFDAELKRLYVAAVIDEIRLRARGTPADTIFFGGGTPSLLEPMEIAAIIAACCDSFAVSADPEVTLEANPEGVTEERLAAFREAGVTRLSFGVQSFRDEELQRLTRLHSSSRAVAAFREARAAGFDNVSLDLMMWLPQQTVAEWLESVDALIDLGPDHASLYMLEVYPNSPLREQMARAEWSVAPDDDVADMYLQSMARLDAAGYEQYEISNVAKPGRRSRHNLKYWTDGEWLGFGPGAHSTIDGMRTRNVSGTADYVDAVVPGGPLVAEARRLSPHDRIEEALFTGLRLTEGLSVDAVRRHYGIDLWAEFGAELQPFRDLGWLIYDEGRLRLTRAGMLLAHEIMAVFIRPAAGPSS